MIHGGISSAYHRGPGLDLTSVRVRRGEKKWHLDRFICDTLCCRIIVPTIHTRLFITDAAHRNHQTPPSGRLAQHSGQLTAVHITHKTVQSVHQFSSLHVLKQSPALRNTCITCTVEHHSILFLPLLFVHGLWTGRRGPTEVPDLILSGLVTDDVQV